MKQITPFLFLLGLFVLFQSCSECEMAKKLEETNARLALAESQLSEMGQAAKPGFIHSVFFWLKEEATPKARATFLEGCQKLANIESVRSLYVGPPAMTPRGSVDNSYDFAVIVHFADRDGHDAYQTDSIHVAMVEAHKNLWDRILIYDNTVE